MTRHCSAPACRCESPCDEWWDGTPVDPADAPPSEVSEAVGAGFDVDMAERLVDAGYELDGGPAAWMSKLVRAATHVARRDHKDGRVLKGQRYRRTTWRNCDTDGASWLEHQKRVIR